MVATLTTEEFIDEVHNYREDDPNIKNKSGKPIVLDFYADWCQPCKMMSPILEELSEKHPEVQFLKVNADDEVELTETFQISALPTLYFIPVEGDTNFIVGAAPEKIIQTAMKEIFG